MERISRSILSEAALAGIIRAEYGLTEIAAVLFWRTGIAGNDVYEILADGSKYLMKIYFHKVDPVQVAASITLMMIVKKHGLPVPAVMLNKNADSVIHIDFPEGRRLGVLFEFIEGIEPDMADEADAFQIGTLLSNLYQAFDTIEEKLPLRSIGHHYLVQNAIDQLSIYLPNEKEKIGYLSNMGKELWARLDGTLENAQLSYGLCHGDFHTGNMKKDKLGHIHLFDFDACGYGYRLFDIGVYANDTWKPTTREELAADRKALDLCSQGYTYQGGVTGAEVERFYSILGLRHLELLGLVLRNCTILEGRHWIAGNFEDTCSWFKQWVSLITKESD